MDRSLHISSVAIAHMQELLPSERLALWRLTLALGMPIGEGAQWSNLIVGLPYHIRQVITDRAYMRIATQVCQWCTEHAVHVCPIGSAGYPPLLALCHDAPVVVYLQGNMPEWRHIALPLAVVGARKLSNEGRTSIRLMLGELAMLVPETLVVSGLAIGADIVAHRVAIDQGLPTLAVLPTGLDTIYPSRHRTDAERIRQHGALLSEYAPYTKLRRERFTQRNRLIAGIARASLIVEAGLPSGTYITALRAWDYDRDVLVVPARIDEPCNRGGYELIRREQASLVASGMDILRMVRGW